jgi:2-polyprenyl-6-methoxyphenol hydroxylase-like FAD-dependent oxidoreductase
MSYDVVIVGASIAGCTAATLYGRAGLTVALVEKHRSAATFKALCGHFVLGGAQATLRRTGLWDAMEREGAAVGRVANWTEHGWVVPDADAPACISLRRERLDPLLRRTVAATPGVDLFLGRTAVSLVWKDGRIAGVRTRDRGGDEHELRGRLVVAADGHRSPVAAMAGVAEDVAPNERFGFWAYYRGVVPRGPGRNQVWRLDPDVGIVVATDDGLTMLVAFPSKARLEEFRGDRAAALEAFVAALPDGPDLSGAERVSKVIGTTDYPCVKRDPTPHPGLVLVGDAAITGDPTPAVGCGWAFRAAEWLVEATAPALRNGGDLDRSLARYRKALRFIERHDAIGRQDARARPMNPLQRAIGIAAAHDRKVARATYLFAMRAVPVSGLLNPGVILRSLLVAWRVRRSTARPAAASTGGKLYKRLSRL